MAAWDVYLENDHGEDKCIDTVFYDDNCDAEYVYRGLVNHDGHDPGIRVERGDLKDFDEWENANYEDLVTEAAETGADREYGFDRPRFHEHKYEEYLDKSQYPRG
jgi:hypothetical protein